MPGAVHIAVIAGSEVAPTAARSTSARPPSPPRGLPPLQIPAFLYSCLPDSPMPSRLPPVRRSSVPYQSRASPSLREVMPPRMSVFPSHATLDARKWHPPPRDPAEMTLRPFAQVPDPVNSGVQGDMTPISRHSRRHDPEVRPVAEPAAHSARAFADASLPSDSCLPDSPMPSCLPASLPSDSCPPLFLPSCFSDAFSFSDASRPTHPPAPPPRGTPHPAPHRHSPPRAPGARARRARDGSRRPARTAAPAPAAGS